MNEVRALHSSMTNPFISPTLFVHCILIVNPSLASFFNSFTELLSNQYTSTSVFAILKTIVLFISS